MQNIARSGADTIAQPKKDLYSSSLFVGATPPPVAPCWWSPSRDSLDLSGAAAGLVYSSTSVTDSITPPHDWLDYDPEYTFSPRLGSFEASRSGIIGQVDFSLCDSVLSSFVPPIISDYEPSIRLSGGAFPNGGYRLDPKLLRVKRLRRTIYNAANLHTQELQQQKSRFTAWFLTLTYGDDALWEPSHITNLVKAMRSYFERKGIKFRYVWVAEIQEKRVSKSGHHGVHYHLVLWLPKGQSVPKPDKRGWWPHGMTNTQKARNATAYLMKYSSKGTEFPFPLGLRTHGHGGLSKLSRVQVAWWNIPKYVRDALGGACNLLARAKGGGWLSRVTGEFLESVWRVVQFSPLIIVPRCSAV